MIIKTITCQKVYNYGASLQAFALQNYLEKEGHNVEIINFCPWYQRGRYELFYISPLNRSYKYTKWFPPLRYLIAPLRNWPILKTYARKYRFDSFDKHYLHLTKKIYYTSDDLRISPPESDIYIAGSDQIWNTDMENGREPAYYLDFGNKNVKRVSYAASFGINEIKSELKEFVKEKISNIDAVSVREATGIDILGRLGINNAVCVVDPVFLLSSEEWGDIASSARQYEFMKKKYILLYDFINDNHIEQFAKYCAEQFDLPIISINDYRDIPYANYNINNAGPLEFVSLIKQATIVISNSFHATAFSCIFNKDFYTFPLKGQRNASRMIDLLSKIGMLERYNPKEIFKGKKIDYCNNLKGDIERSKLFLSENLQ